MSTNIDKQSRVSGIGVPVLHSINNPSTQHVQDFATLSARSLRANVLLNSDDHSVPIHAKNPSALLEAIDNNISQIAKDWGVSIQEVEAMLGSSKRIIEPVCGVTANSIMKLFLDNDIFSYSFEKGQSLSLSQIQEQLASLPAHKNFILRVKDGGLGHAYVIDFPATINPSRDAFLYQSDLGEGVTRELRFEDWMTQKAAHPISLDDINTHFTGMSQNQIDLAHIAKLFDIDGNVKMMRAEHLNSHKTSEFNFQFFEYDLKNLENNMSIIKTRCD
jgi:hypothetical protein